MTESEEGHASESHWLGMLTRFYRYLDAMDAVSLCALTHPDILWVRQGKELRTSDEIIAAVMQRPLGLHVYHMLNSVTFEVLNEDRVRYSGYLIVIRAQGATAPMPPSGLQSLHVCEGELRRTPEGWLISAMNAGSPRVVFDLKRDFI